jgi:hypothetical protein
MEDHNYSVIVGGKEDSVVLELIKCSSFMFHSSASLTAKTNFHVL